MRWGNVMVAILVVAQAHAAPDPDAIRKARDAVYQKLEVQRELPGGGDHTDSVPPPQQSGPDAQDDRDGGGSFVGSTILWILIGAVGVIIIANAVAALLARRARPQRIEPRTVLDPEVAPEPLPDAFLVAAEAQAQGGQFAEAIHGLLLATLTELLSRDRTALLPSWTSREVLARTVLGQGARAALGELIATVETSHFGAAVVGPDDFARCRARYRDFASAYAGAA